MSRPEIQDTSSDLIVETGDDLGLTVIHSQSPTRIFFRRFVHNKLALIGAGIILIMMVVAVAAPILAPYDPQYQDYRSLYGTPSAAHLLGTDQLGRDMLSRIMFGARVSMAASVIAVLIALVIGVPIGLIAGYYKGILGEWIIMRIVDAVQAFPFLILALALEATLGISFLNAMIAIGIGFSPAFIRIVRGEVLRVGAQDYILACRAIGTPDWRVILRHVLPNSLPPLLVLTSVSMAGAVLAEAGLSFLGLGVSPPTPSWGVMLTDAQSYILLSYNLAIWPGIAIFLVVFGFNVLGDGVRDSLDPRFSP
jgi:ABC-type dipeptide/oligopeptide/nickel transport system permease subunit